MSILISNKDLRKFEEYRKNVVFIAGSEKYSSVKIRAIQIAEFLKCDVIRGTVDIKDLSNKKLFICVKPEISNDEILRLMDFGTVVWDLHDHKPPEGLDLYLVSSEGGQAYAQAFGPTYLIPHHHCNFSGIPNKFDLNKGFGWIGRPYWCPDEVMDNAVIYNTNMMSVDGIVKAYRNIGASLNVRKQTNESQFHISINPGVKLLNSIGFGLPSISNKESAFLKFPTDCTLFVENIEIPTIMRNIASYKEVFYKQHLICLRLAEEYHISTICSQYIKLLLRILK